MVTQPEAHAVTVQAPWYAPTGSTVAIQRYLDPGFVQQFQADVSNSPASNQAALFAWEQEDRMPANEGGVLKLRRPVHKTFYIVAWEAYCKLPTLPAIGPEKIDSAGFVIRTGTAAAPQGFQLVQSVPQGWGPVEPGADPDATRQIKALGLVPQSATPNPGYTGEETFPLHPLPVQDSGNPHTLLFGYLPIGGGSYVPPSPPPPPADTGDSMLTDLPWPFGLAGYSNGPPSTYTFDQQITQGQINSAMAALLRVVLGRYQLVDPDAWTNPQNATLVGILNGLQFYADPATALTGQALRDWAAANPAPNSTLGAVLLDYANTPAPASAGGSQDPAAPVITTAQMFLAALLQADPTSSATPLPASSKLQAGAQNLLVVQNTAAQIRAALRLLLINAQAASSAAMPVPKLISGPTGSYFVQAFVRTLRPDGCVRIHWGQPSETFAVAAAFDPDAARPSLIEMPSLSDVKKGVARGAAFDMPADLADLMNGMTSSAAVQKMWNGGGGPSGGLGIRFICSFSLPVLMICAMLMLMVVIVLLNIFLGWMAWVKICLPFPSKQ